MSNNTNASNISAMPNSYKDLLTLATAVKGDVPMDESIKPMSKEDQKWLEETIKTIGIQSDPIKKLEIIIDNFRKVKPVAQMQTEELGNLQSMLENNLLHMICDMDLAYDFCKIGGLDIFDKFLIDFVDKRIAGSFLKILSESAANNIKVQELLIKRDYLNYCLDGLSFIEDELYVKQCLGAISAMVKAYIPGLVKLTCLNGLDKLKKCFNSSIHLENKLLVHRCGVVISNLAGSLPEKIINDMKVVDLLNYVKKILLDNGEKYEETLNYIQS